MSDPRRRIPRTDLVLADARVAEAARRHGRALVRAAVVTAQQRARRGEITPEAVVEAALSGLPEPVARPVINATGVLVHTNLGRAPLSAAARAAVAAAAGNTDVEFDLRTGRRAARGRGALAALAALVPEAGAVHVVNNNAAALLLCALTLARGRSIVISRGELVEIGDGFRLPDLLAGAGAQLREVGTTNRTSLRDYTRAIDAETAFILKVHPSNFQVTGFTESVEVAALADLGPPVVVDIGSGLLAPHPLLPHEPDAASALRAGAALVTASGDKLLGGPQAGLILGRADLVQQLRRHPTARALRVDKLTLAALHATLSGPPVPVAAALAAAIESLQRRAEALVAELTAAGIDAAVTSTNAVVGGGGAPGVALPSRAVSLPAAYATPLRTGSVAVVGRVERDRCLLDLRAVEPEDDAVLSAAVLAVGSGGAALDEELELPQ
ncbi:MAG: L-seryl-tRNA(Sec) selenium transferase, partial [Micromonosporaceae bacterium]